MDEIATLQLRFGSLQHLAFPMPKSLLKKKRYQTMDEISPHDAQIWLAMASGFSNAEITVEVKAISDHGCN